MICSFDPMKTMKTKKIVETKLKNFITVPGFQISL